MQLTSQAAVLDGLLKVGKPHASHDATAIPEVGSQCLFFWLRQLYTGNQGGKLEHVVQFMKPDAAANRNLLQA